MGSKATINLTVLVVEEQRAVRKIIEQIFNTIGISFVELAEDGNEALAWLDEGGLKFDLIVCDHHMEKISGVEFCKKVRAAEGKYYKDIPIILVSGEKTDDLVAEVKSLGVPSVLQKPFSPLAMKQEIEKTIGFAL